MLKSLFQISAATLFAVVFAALLCATPQQTAGAQATGTRSASKSAPAPAPAAAPAPDPRAKAKSIYQIDCAMCHGDNGDGKTDLAASMKLNMPDYTNPATLASKSDKELFDLIRAGKDNMPPEDPSRAKDDEVRGLIAYIRSLSSGSAAAPPAAAN
jgi:mono/diheme cytochrome c family protein